MKGPIDYIEDGLTLGRGGAWAWFAIATRSYDLLSPSQRIAEAMQLAQSITALRDAECHLVVAPRAVRTEEWAAALDEDTTSPQPMWDAYLTGLEQHLATSEFVDRCVFLGVRLGARAGWRRKARTIEEAAGVAAARVAGSELKGWRRRLDLIHHTVAGSGLRVRPATADELRWAVQRSFYRGMPVPKLLPVSRAWGGAIQTLIEGTVHNGRRSLRIEQADGDRWLTFLTVAHMPDTLSFPGQEWLYQTDLLGSHVDASVRFRVVPPREAAAAAGRKLIEATDQARNIGGGPATLPLAVMETAERARELEDVLTRDGVPLVYGQTTLCVSAGSAHDLEAAVVDCEELYRDLGIELARPSGDQLSLFMQALPSERWRVKSYEQRMAPITLAGAMPHATVALGDGTGPYVGFTTGRSRTQVHFDPLLAARSNEPTGVAITGAPGGGKTTLAQLLTYQMAMRGAWVLAIDPKGDTARLGEVGDLGRVDVVDLGGGEPGALDPFSIAGTPAEAALLAADTCRLLLAGGLKVEQEAALLGACRAVASTGAGTLTAVVETLAASETPEARTLAATLSAYTDLAGSSLCFAPSRASNGPHHNGNGNGNGNGHRNGHGNGNGTGNGNGHRADGSAVLRRLEPTNGVTVLTFGNLSLPAQGTPRSDHTLAERFAVAVLHLVTALAARLADAPSSQPKAVVLDEAWAVTSSSAGRALVQRLARTGRSRNVALVLVSQNAGDFLDETITNCLSAKFAFRSTQDDEVGAVVRLLGLDATPEEAVTLRTLSNGECIFADVAGRVGTTQIDLAMPHLVEALCTTPGRVAPLALADRR